MSRGINKVILIGNLGIEPEVKVMTSGESMCNLSLATNRSWQDKKTGEIKTHTEWHRLIFFRKLAEIVKQYLHKGSKIYVDGYLRTRKWQDNTGIERYITEVIVDNMVMLGGRSDSIENAALNKPVNVVSTPTLFFDNGIEKPLIPIDENDELKNGVIKTPVMQEILDDDIPF